MATVTWPSFSSSPRWTLSSVGVASLIHRSWLGLVKTPMFGLDAFVVPFILRRSNKTPKKCNGRDVWKSWFPEKLEEKAG